MNLTAKQVKCFDEIATDREANKRTLEVAIGFHANLENELIKRNTGIWNDLTEIHDLDRDTVWGIKRIDGFSVIVKHDEIKPID